ncbi:MAG: CDP-diacylglycerol--glycerol-3-phosphate 3-phosphatidyltransferase [Fibrobacteraceae bacterium]
MPLSESLKLRMRGRVWRLIRTAIFFPIIYCIWTEHSLLAASCIAVALIMGWLNMYELRVQETEEPYYQLWLSVAESFLSFAVLTSVLIRNIIKFDELEKLLAVGCVFLLIRLVAYTLLSLSILREGKLLHGKGAWAKFANLSIMITMGVYVLNLEPYMQICMVASILLMAASGAAFTYWFYRDPEHRKPLSVASQLTMTRIVLTPVFLWVFFYDNDLDYSNNNLVFKILALLMILGFMLTDYLDGHLARKMGEVSTLGKYLDPFSDKISNMTVFLCFIATGYAHVWMVALIYFREASVETLRTLAASENIIMPARMSGKIKTAIQGIGIVIILTGALNPLQTIPAFRQVWEYLPTTVMGIITIVTLASGVDYFIASKNILKKFV